MGAGGGGLCCPHCRKKQMSTPRGPAVTMTLTVGAGVVTRCHDMSVWVVIAQVVGFVGRWSVHSLLRLGCSACGMLSAIVRRT